MVRLIIFYSYLFLFMLDALLPIPTLFFSATAFFFSAEDISPQVFTVLLLILLLGLHFLVFLFLVDPQGLPFSSVHFSLNKRRCKP